MFDRDTRYSDPQNVTKLVIRMCMIQTIESFIAT